MKEKRTLNKIYVYTTHSANLVHSSVKVGKTIRDADVRIGEQDTTIAFEPPIRVKNSKGEPLEFGTYLTDDEVRERLYNTGKFVPTREDKDREWVSGFSDPINNGDAIEYEINKIISDYAKESGNESRPEQPVPYFYKEYINLVFLALLDIALAGKQKIIDFALELAPRFGKTLWAINLLIILFKNYNYRVCVLPSYWLSSLTSFQSDLVKYRGLEDYIHYVKRGDDIADAIRNWYGKKLIVVDLSLHMDYDKFEKEFEPIFNIDDSKVISLVDEADFGAWKQKKMLDRLGSSLNVYMSGSGLEKMVYNLENLDDRIIRFSYTDMLLVKEGKHPLFFD